MPTCTDEERAELDRIAEVRAWREKLLLLPSELFDETCAAAHAAPGYDEEAHGFYLKTKRMRAWPENVARRAAIEALQPEGAQ